MKCLNCATTLAADNVARTETVEVTAQLRRWAAHLDSGDDGTRDCVTRSLRDLADRLDTTVARLRIHQSKKP